MVIHKRTKLTPRMRQQLARDYHIVGLRKVDLMRKYDISFPTVQKILLRAGHGDFSVHRSINWRYQCLEYGLKRLSKISARIEAKLKKQAIRYEKSYPGELLHLDTKRLPLLKHETRQDGYEYLFVAIDDYSRELYADIHPDKSNWSSATFLLIRRIKNYLEYAGNGEWEQYDEDGGLPTILFVVQNKSVHKRLRNALPTNCEKATRSLCSPQQAWSTL